MTPLQQALPPRLSLKFLGGFSVLGADGSPPVLSYAKLRALLACLAIERGNELQRSWLAGLLWPEFDEAGARQNLRRALSNLRAALGDEDGEASLFRISRTSISLNPALPIDIDVADFLAPPEGCDATAADQPQCRDCLTRMEALAARYRGELLPGFTLPDNPEFEEWLTARREQLHRHALQLFDRLAACHGARGNPARALPFGLRLLDLDPWNEVALRRVMRIYVAGGQASAALTQFHAFRRELADELGVLPDQETRRLADEIGPAVQPQAPAEVESRDPERRQVTAVCCQLSPADGREIDEVVESLPALRQRCEAMLCEQGGHPAPMQGGVLVYFGYPRADELAPLRAVSAALALAGSPAFAEVALRIGIHTGLVFSDVDSGEIDVAGTTSGIAMALPLLVGGGTVALTLPTYRLVAGYFHCETLGNWRLGGEQRALGLVRVLAPTGAEHRLQASRNRLSPFVGRERELQVLTETWQAAQNGSRRLLLLSGDAGIGKSRLAQALCERLAADGVPVVDFSCQSESAQEALRPLLALLARHLGAAPGEAAAATRERMLRLARQLFPQENDGVAGVTDLADLADWLLDIHGASPVADDGRRQRALTLLLDLVDRYAQRQPLLLLLEDVHWADPSTLELIGQFQARTTAARVLLLATARPEFDAPAGWDRLPLPPMSAGTAAAMIEAMAEGRSLPEPLVQRIVEFADGVPLFVEETTRMLLKGVAGHGRPDLLPAIPHSLRDLLASQLDALDEAKPVAQHAAILGRRFALEQLAALMELPAAAIEPLLARLEAAGVVARELGSCQFRHALIREAAYQSLPLSRRKALHRSTAELLRRQKPLLAEQQPGLIAHHYTAAGAAAEALEFHERAADLALRYAAYREHVWHLRQAIEQLPRLAESAAAPAPTELAATEVRLLAQLGWAVGEVEGLGSATAREIHQRAFALCRDAAGGPELFKTLLGLWRGSSSWSGYPQSLELGDQLLAIAEAADDPQQTALACYALGNVHCALGNLDTSIGYLQRSVAGYDPEMPVAAYGDSAGVSAHAFLGWVHTLRGDAAAGLREAQAAITLARTLGHPPALCYALIFAAETYRLRADPAAALACAEEAATLADACGIIPWRVFAEIFLGWGEALAGRPQGLQRAQQALDRVMGSIMAGTAAPLFAAVVEAALQLGEHDHGLRAADQALALMARNHGRHLQANLLLLRAELLARLGRADEARASAGEALAVAGEQGAGLFETRAAAAVQRLADAGG